jgi:hypothetical protein
MFDDGTALIKTDGTVLGTQLKLATMADGWFGIVTKAADGIWLANEAGKTTGL